MSIDRVLEKELLAEAEAEVLKNLESEIIAAQAADHQPSAGDLTGADRDGVEEHGAGQQGPGQGEASADGHEWVMHEIQIGKDAAATTAVADSAASVAPADSDGLASAPSDITATTGPECGHDDGVIRQSSFHNGNRSGQVKAATRSQEIRSIRLDSINVSDAQMRPVNNTWVKKCAKDMKDGAKFPPPEVCEERDEASGKVTTRLTNGRHRVEAMKMLGVVEAECVVRQGNLTDALMDAACSNIEFLRLTRADKRHKVATVLRLNYNWTDNRIATHCGFVPSFVANVRAEYDAEHGIVDGDTGVRESIDGRLISRRAPKPAPTSRGADGGEAPNLSAQKMTEPAERGDAHEQQAPCKPTDAQVGVHAPTDLRSAITGTDEMRSHVLENRVGDAWKPVEPKVDDSTATDTAAGAAHMNVVAGSSVKPGGTASGEQDVVDDTAELAGSVLKIKFTTRSGAESEALFDLDNPDGPLHDDLILLRPTMKNFKALQQRGVSRAAMDVILDRIWGAR